VEGIEKGQQHNNEHTVLGLRSSDDDAPHHATSYVQHSHLALLARCQQGMEPVPAAAAAPLVRHLRQAAAAEGDNVQGEVAALVGAVLPRDVRCGWCS
jgi:hypothetical protein